MRQVLWLVALGLLAASCSRQPDSTGALAELAIYEAVFRHKLQGLPAEARLYLSVANQDAPPELLRRLRETWPNLEPASRQPKGTGTTFYAHALTWLDRDTVEVQVGSTRQTKHHPEQEFADFRVVRQGGQWVVEGKTNETTS